MDIFAQVQNKHGALKHGNIC